MSEASSEIGLNIPQSLLIVGASVRHAAELAALLGIRVFAIDLFSDSETQHVSNSFRVNEFSEVLDLLPEIQAEFWMYTGGMENRADLIRSISKEIPLAGCNAYVAKHCKDSFTLFELVSRAGFQVPNFAKASEFKQIDQKRSWLCKNNESVGGLGVFQLEHSTSQRFDYFQELIPGRSCSAVFIANSNQCAFAGATHQLVGWEQFGSKSFQYCGSAGPLFEIDAKQKEVLTCLGKHLARELKLVGLFGIDFIQNDSGIWFLEVNPRFPASLEVFSNVSNVNLIQAHLAACVDDELPTAIEFLNNRQVFKAILYNRFELPLAISSGFWNACRRVLESQQANSWQFKITDTSDCVSIQPRHPVCTLICEASVNEPQWMKQILTLVDNIYEHLKSQSVTKQDKANVHSFQE